MIFINFCTFWRLKLAKFRAQKVAVLGLLNFPKLISRKIWLTEKSWNFHTVHTYMISNPLMYLQTVNQLVWIGSFFSSNCTSGLVIKLVIVTRIPGKYPKIKTIQSFGWGFENTYKNRYTVWKNEKFTLPWKKFREISLKCYLVLNELISRNFCKRSSESKFL